MSYKHLKATNEIISREFSSPSERSKCHKWQVPSMSSSYLGCCRRTMKRVMMVFMGEVGLSLMGQRSQIMLSTSKPEILFPVVWGSFGQARFGFIVILTPAEYTKMRRNLLEPALSSSARCLASTNWMTAPVTALRAGSNRAQYSDAGRSSFKAYTPCSKRVYRDANPILLAAFYRNRLLIQRQHARSWQRRHSLMKFNSF